ncbi:hypothetical protein BJ508DRAFT_381899 [Ascobolus immersus RN42]|uniref:BTB domain-containing protein n=1 Tax=Ascobolus immersus RN42 TaxID=1160509 RepID=A0A3N4HBB1_ASCIM|nr:hypothetical protein BJ508DRAFT_381899 [Ascobolus immersus RN42]
MSNGNGDNDLVLKDAVDDGSDDEAFTPPESRTPSPSNIRPQTYDPKHKTVLDVKSVGESLFMNDEYSDFKIVVGDRIWPAHRTIVCTQSAFFKAALRGGFMEAQEGMVRITDESPKDIYRILSFLYTHDYHDYGAPYYEEFGKLNREERWGRIYLEDQHYATRTNLSMHRLADKYGIEGLAKRSLEKEDEVIASIDDIWELCSVGSKIYSETEKQDHPFRQTFKKWLFDSSMLYWDAETLDCEPVRKLLKENADLGYDLILKLYEMKDEEETKKLQFRQAVKDKIAEYTTEIVDKTGALPDTDPNIDL